MKRVVEIILDFVIGGAIYCITIIAMCIHGIAKKLKFKFITNITAGFFESHGGQGNK